MTTKDDGPSYLDIGLLSEGGGINDDIGVSGGAPPTSGCSKCVSKAKSCFWCCFRSIYARFFFVTIFFWGSLMWLMVASYSLAEASGNYYVPLSLAWVTPSCSADTGAGCPAGLEDIVRDISEPTEAMRTETFSYVVASDSQLDWFAAETYDMGTGHRPKVCTDDESCSRCTAKVGEQTNKEQASAIMALLDGTNPVQPPDASWPKWAKPTAAVMNGDLTSYFHPGQLKSYKNFYDPIGEKYRYYPGLGNHDYENNIGAYFGTDQW